MLIYSLNKSCAKFAHNVLFGNIHLLHPDMVVAFTQELILISRLSHALTFEKTAFSRLAHIPTLEEKIVTALQPSLHVYRSFLFILRQFFSFFSLLLPLLMR